MSGIYIHIPFCASRCIYCDFYSTTLHHKATSYVEALIREMDERKRYLCEPIRTIYFGGGTPSQLGPDNIAAILRALASRFDLSQCEEITIEANPEDFIDGTWPLAGTASLPFAGGTEGISVNRVSLGVQSMVDSELRLLRRRHTADHVSKAVSLLRESGIRNLSLDLMYGLPAQTLDSWRYSIDAILRLRPQHISAYNLSIEPGTPLDALVQAGKLTPADDDTCLQMAALLRQKLQDAGYVHYEISNYALPGLHSRHNSSYWQPTPYLGLGPGAHSYDGRNRRTWNAPDLTAYLNGIRHEEAETLTPADIYNERLMLGLRTARGVAHSELLRLLPPSASTEALQSSMCSLQHRGLLRIDDGRLTLTEAGLALADEVIRELMFIE